jgi:hypothetical protein
LCHTRSWLREKSFTSSFVIASFSLNSFDKRMTGRFWVPSSAERAPAAAATPR